MKKQRKNQKFTCFKNCFFLQQEAVYATQDVIPRNTFFLCVCVQHNLRAMCYHLPFVILLNYADYENSCFFKFYNKNFLCVASNI